MSLRDQEDTAGVLRIPTMGVNARGDLRWTGKFVETLSDKELVGVLAHEALHYGLNHMLRGRGRDHKMFNQATDLVVNDILITSGMTLPHGGLVPSSDHKFNFGSHMIDKINERPAEDVYRIMMQHAEEGGGSGKGGGTGDHAEEGGGTGDQNQEGEGDRRDDGGWDNHDYSEDPDQQPMSDQERKQLEKDAKGKMIEARNYAKSRGQMPLGIERIIEKLIPHKVNWRQYINAVIVDQVPYDFSWGRPGRKSAATGVIMPGVVRDKTIDVVVAVDTSGSVDHKMLRRFVSEVVGICNCYPNVKMTLMSHDHEVHSVLQVDRMSGDPVEQVMRWKPKGGGGTSHRPVWDWIKKNRPDCKVFIGLTDGYTDWGDPQPWSALFLISEGGVDVKNVPWGRALPMPASGEEDK